MEVMKKGHMGVRPKRTLYICFIGSLMFEICR